MSRLRRLLRDLVERALFDYRRVDWSDKLISAEQVRYVHGLVGLYEKIRPVPGHIVELGVGRGRNAVIFGTLARAADQGAFRRYYGFDTFEGYPSDVADAERQLDARAHTDSSLEFVEEVRDRNGLRDQCRFLRGDLRATLPDLLRSGDDVLKGFVAGGARIALVYVDCNAYAVARFALETLEPYLVDGAVIAIDECIQGGETRALEEFCAARDYVLEAGNVGGVISAWTRVSATTDS